MASREVQSELIKKLRKGAGLTQEQVAHAIGVARTTYLAIEAGQRELNVSELEALAELYKVHPVSIIEGQLEDAEEASSYPPEAALAEPSDIIPREIDPKVNPAKLKNVLLYILGKVGAKPNVGETVLYKLLYFIDFDYYEKTGRSITGLSYIKNHYGPTPVKKFEGIVAAMVKNRELDIVETPYFMHTQKKYLPIVRASLSSLTADEIKHIDSELSRLSDKSAAELSDLSHKDMPWLAAKMHKRIDYQMAMYRTDATSVRDAEDDL
jgi:transcriptional regulator with XRE-family HTH domain